MSRPVLEVADVFRRFGAEWRAAYGDHLSLDQRRVMTAIEICRTSALGGHAEQCADCGHRQIAYNSCRNRHCPKCQWRAAEQWLEARKAELLPVPYFHVVFTLPAQLGQIGFQNKRLVYGLLMRAAAEALGTIAADPQHLGAQIGVTAVLHTWGQTLDHHPHVHCIVPGGGIALDGNGWVQCRPKFFLPVRVLSRLFRRLFIDGLLEAYARGKLRFYGALADLAEPGGLRRAVLPLKRREWVVYAKEPFAGPNQVLAYLARYTHRVAISNRRLVAIGDDHVSFRWKDYRSNGRRKPKTMRLVAAEFMRRFLLHVLPSGFHRIRHYGLFANGRRQEMLRRCRRFIGMVQPAAVDAEAKESEEASTSLPTCCPLCGGDMRIIEVFAGIYARRRYPRRQDGL